MATVISRVFKSNPERNSDQTWMAIVDLLTKGKQSDARKELLSVSGVAASIITDQYPKDYPIVITCEGPRTKIYCLYDDKAIEGDDANEDTIGFDPLEGEWSLSLPCANDDLNWVQNALAKSSKKIVARELGSKPTEDSKQSNTSKSLLIDQNGFLGI